MAIFALARRHRSLAVYRLLAIAMLLAQVLALSHLYTHFDRISDPAGLAGRATHQVCGECVSFSPVLTAVGGAIADTFISAAARAQAPILEPYSPPRPIYHHAFRSRAPPFSG